ncbi:MAG: SusF/SusE family outer membrane protein [Tannerellaceae bacterium]|nr:SusF/SusE family outer membrane protein [Tannerellaceae bacterium]
MNYINNIYKLFLLVAITVGFCACEDDRDSNPTLNIPASFVLNQPPYTSGVYDLENTSTILLTTSQPDYGFTAATTYEVQVAFVDDFSKEENYKTLATSYTTARMEVIASEIALAMNELLGITDASDFPDETMTLYIRLKASLYNDNGVVYSNSIELPNVLGYFTFEDPYPLIPINGNNGKFWRIRYFESGEVATIYFTKIYEKDQYENEEIIIVDNAGSGATVSNGVITVDKTGWYLIHVATILDGTTLTQTVEFLPPNVYLIGDVIGGLWVATEEGTFELPETGEGDFVSPVLEKGGELRMCVIIEGYDWWRTEFMIYNNIIEYRADGDDQDPRVEVTPGQQVTLNFANGTGNIK